MLPPHSPRSIPGRTHTAGHAEYDTQHRGAFRAPAPARRCPLAPLRSAHLGLTRQLGGSSARGETSDDAHRNVSQPPPASSAARAGQPLASRGVVGTVAGVCECKPGACGIESDSRVRSPCSSAPSPTSASAVLIRARAVDGRAAATVVSMSTRKGTDPRSPIRARAVAGRARESAAQRRSPRVGTLSAARPCAPMVMESSAGAAADARAVCGGWAARGGAPSPLEPGRPQEAQR
jgi:hypothetical protein